MKIYLILAFGLFGLNVWAGAQEKAKSKEALENTQQQLVDTKTREAAISKNKDAQKADEFVKKMVGGDAVLTDEIYALASQVFANVVEDAGGDPQKMRDAMDKFTKDPASFLETWTPEQKETLRKLSEKLPQPILKN